MTPGVIAEVWIAAGVALVVGSYIFTAKLLKKREEGLDNIKAILDKREALIEDSEKNVKGYAEATEKLMRLLNEKNEQLAQLQKDLFTWADTLEKYQIAVDENWERVSRHMEPIPIEHLIGELVTNGRWIGVRRSPEELMQYYCGEDEKKEKHEHPPEPPPVIGV